MSCEEPEMLPAAVAGGPLDDDNLLSEILLRLSPLPSSLPRASFVCKRWRSIASDPAFSRRFRLHHRRNPPLLGCFHKGAEGISFEPTLEAPDRVPPGRLSLQSDRGDLWFLGCRHGLVLIFDKTRLQFMVWDPVTGHKHYIADPPGLDVTKYMINGAVFRSCGGDVHFQVVLVAIQEAQAVARVYSSETRLWGNLITAPVTSESGDLFVTYVTMEPAVLVGHALYWILSRTSSHILEFDLERESLAVIRMPVYLSGAMWLKLMQANDGKLGILYVSGFIAQLWKRNTDLHGVASWGMGTTVELDKLLSLDPRDVVIIQGFAEDNHLLLLKTITSLFTLKLEELQFKKLFDTKVRDCYYPFESVYGAGT
ncbi:hypothetical protein CFC21_081921 [Triticum aestivum]|uniref:F-box domain-containing protein n=3 Tax=Triticum TaxID=4564 RepID=A0A9R1AW06_TRITD|nr:hypothetical protein CFC21_081921 [Triticum aestivum]VAI42279.1 unnamed protein product [Triticum turgidum subsp. durum]